MFFKEKSAAFDRRYSQITNKLDFLIANLSSVDATGQVFRYPYDTENNKHLVELSIINIVAVRKSLSCLESLFEKLTRLSEFLVDEYSCKSFTAKLSRNDILNIAASLPSHGYWDSKEFLQTKKFYKQVFSLSNNDFSKAINIIKNNYEACATIKLQKNIPHLTEDAIGLFFDWWSRFHDLNTIFSPSPPSIVGQDVAKEDIVLELEKYSSLRRECWSECGSFCHKSLATLKSLFYFFREMRFSESFDRHLEIQMRDLARRSSEDDGEFKESFFHLMNKTNALENITNSLNFLGQNDLLNFVIARYGLQPITPTLLSFSESRKWRPLHI